MTKLKPYRQIRAFNLPAIDNRLNLFSVSDGHFSDSSHRENHMKIDFLITEGKKLRLLK